MQLENGSRSSRLFLIELMIAVLFFSLGSVVCVQAFARAHSTGLEARELSFASSAVSGAANVVRYTDGSPESFRDYYPQAQQQDGGLAVCYDKGFAPCGEPEAAYVLHVETEDQGLAVAAHIWMEDLAGKLIYELDLRYPGRPGEVQP